MKIIEKMHRVMPMRFIVDGYAPLHIMFGDELSNQLYYRYVGEDYLLEIGIDPEGSNLSSINIVQVNEYMMVEDVKVTIPSSVIEGLPCYDLSEWNRKSHVDNNDGFVVEISKSQICIRLSDNVNVVDVYHNENVYIGCANDKTVLWILVDRITDEQYRQIEDVISGQQNHGFLH